MDNQVKSLDEIISDITISIGIPANIIGSAYISEAVKLVIHKPNVLLCITKELYPTIANKYNTKVANVERGIRHAIEVAWSKNRIIALNKIFNLNIYLESEKPCNSEFIALLAERIPHLMKKNNTL